MFEPRKMPTFPRRTDIVSDAETIPMPPPLPDPAAEELLAPAGAPVQAPVSESVASADAFAQALRNGTIPQFSEQPADTEVVADPPPLNADEERAAWQNLIAFINQHKDEGTRVEIADPDSFMKGLS
ncbi:MAG: hypothetical protein H6876_06310 [Hyphomicrobiaceae bacterium]|nr:hypothetical protein [Hyphomicrobiaceae bacterium]